MSDSYHELAQICLNGHVINTLAREYPETNQPFCAKCGSKTITTCPSCNTPIRGKYIIPGILDLASEYSKPGYCYKCGKPYPWTESSINAAKELADTLDDLSDNDKVELKQSIQDLSQDSPRTPVAEAKFKKIMRKVGKETFEGMKSILTDIISESVKKTIFKP